jgi:hypothetical protein
MHRKGPVLGSRCRVFILKAGLQTHAASGSEKRDRDEKIHTE